jgi:CMP-N-acetylneuraminic acid synthetase
MIISNDPKIYSVIPARIGSKGVPLKNIKKLNDKPLIAYSIEASQKCKSIHRTIVSTDSERIAKIAREYNAEVPFLRPSELAQDHSTDDDVISHVLNWFLNEEKHIPDYIVYLRPTTPLRDFTVIEQAINMILKAPNATGLRSIQEMSETAYKCLEIQDGLLKTIFTHSPAIDSANKPRQWYAKTYQANGYVDIIRSSYFLKHKQLFGDHVLGFITQRVSEVDTIEDFEFLKYQIERGTK